MNEHILLVMSRMPDYEQNELFKQRKAQVHFANVVAELVPMNRAGRKTMPAIFNDQNRDIVRGKMLQTGFELLKKYGVKRMTVSEIAKACGLAKGTFYTFFPSKEDFIYQIIVYRRNMVKQKYTDMIEQYGQIGREQLIEFFLYTQDNDLSIYQYMTEQDMRYLTIKWPKEYSFDPSADEVTTKWLMSHMKNLRNGVNWKVLANFMKTLACMDMSKELLHKEALPETRQMMCAGLLDYLFENVT